MFYKMNKSASELNTIYILKVDQPVPPTFVNKSHIMQH